MDRDDIRHDCVQECMEFMEVCLIGDGSFYTCYEEHTRCMGHCAVVAKEDSDARVQPS